MIVALGLHSGKLIDENVPFFLTDCACVRADRSRPRSPVPHAGLQPLERARRRDTEIRRVTARTDPETVRAHVNRINRWQMNVCDREWAPGGCPRVKGTRTQMTDTTGKL